MALFLLTHAHIISINIRNQLCYIQTNILLETTRLASSTPIEQHEVPEAQSTLSSPAADSNQVPPAQAHVTVTVASVTEEEEEWVILFCNQGTQMPATPLPESPKDEILQLLARQYTDLD